MATTTILDQHDHPNVKIPPPLIYVAGFLIGLLLDKSLPVAVLSRTPSRIGGSLCIALWVLLGAWSIGLFRRARTSLLPIRPTTTLVVSGPYRLTRNPMYLALAFLYVGLALWFLVFWALVLLPAVIAVVQYFVIAREEKYLEEKFEEGYRQYRVRVRRWI
jgi:protein-S-isoprenylcysteine O-methyltransferase Ste14